MKQLFEPGSQLPVAVMRTGRRSFFGNLVSGFCFAATWTVNPEIRTVQHPDIDGNHVKYAIENFDIADPPVPWTMMLSSSNSKPRVFHASNGREYYIGWNTWAEEFGLYNPVTKVMYLLTSPERKKP